MHKVCIAGLGQKTSVWLNLDGRIPVGCLIASPKRQERYKLDEWFSRHFLVVPVSQQRGPRNTKICQYLTCTAGKQAATALRDYSVESLAQALMNQYGWQIANGAQPLTERGEAAKVYAGNYSVYLFETIARRKKAEEDLANPPTCVDSSIRWLAQK